jgi:hypothetical protein
MVFKKYKLKNLHLIISFLKCFLIHLICLINIYPKSHFEILICEIFQMDMFIIVQINVIYQKFNVWWVG